MSAGQPRGASETGSHGSGTLRTRNLRPPEGEIILFPGPPHELYRLHSGLVRIHLVDARGHGLTLRYVRPGGYFGEEAVSRLERRYFAEAAARTEVESIDPGRLDEEGLRALVAHLAEALEGVYRSLQRLSSKRLRASSAAALLDLQDSPLATRDERGRVVVHITHEELAATIGSVRETVTKVVGELSRAGAIRSGYGRIVVRDPARLEREAEA